ncbi:MAG: DUF4214 domain-containing protein [Candidatus Dormibacteria bacterium]
MNRPPAQWIAKMYTELLGRLPTPAEWRTDLERMSDSSVDAEALRGRAREFLRSDEYHDLAYDPGARVLTLYRALLNREPDQSGFTQWLERLERHDDASEGILSSPEFAAVAAEALGANPNYYFGVHPVLNLPVNGEGLRGGGADDLERALAEVPPGGIVWLAQKAVFRLGRQVVIDDRTVATVGLPGPELYAQQGRLVRQGAFDGGMVRLRGAARLLNVWTDGRRCRPANRSFSCFNVDLVGADQAEISFGRHGNSMGASTLHPMGHLAPRCRRVIFRGNLIECYSSEHYMLPGLSMDTWTDGISNHCEGALIEDNSIVDATDVAIVSFMCGDNGVQRSIVRRNTVLQAGNSGYGGIVSDPFLTREGKGRFSFEGHRVDENLVLTSPVTHLDIGISVGTRAWFGDRSDLGIGSTWTKNRVTGRAGTGLLVHGHHDVVVEDNAVEVSHAPEAVPPFHQVAASHARGWAGGRIQSFDEFEPDICIGHSIVPSWLPRVEPGS